MNYALDDRHRSVRRFLMNALGSPPWTVRTERQPVTDDARPVAVVEAAPPVVTTRSRTSIPQGDIEKQQTFSLMLYPALGATAAEARMAAEGPAELLESAIAVGLVWDADDPQVIANERAVGELLTAPEMLPVYDFAGVAVKGANRAGPADPYGWLRAEDYPVRTIQDPDDPLRWTVACDLRVSWSEAGRDRPPAPLVSAAGFRGTGEFEPPGSPVPWPLGGGSLDP